MPERIVNLPDTLIAARAFLKSNVGELPRTVQLVSDLLIIVERTTARDDKLSSDRAKLIGLARDCINALKRSRSLVAVECENKFKEITGTTLEGDMVRL